jgi:cell division protein FtsW (lipid II flippase)
MTRTLRLTKPVIPPDVKQGYEDEPASAWVNRRERRLLLVATLFIITIQTSLVLAKRLDLSHFAYPLIWVVCATIGHLVLRRTLPKRDPLIFPVVMLLTGWGLVTIDRLAPPFAIRQALWLLIAMTALISVIIAPGHLRWLSRYRYLWLLGGLALLGLTVLLGTNPSGVGPRLWLGIFDLYYQPSELLKILLIVFLASYLADNHAALDLVRRRIGPIQIPPLRFLAPLLVMWGVSIVVLVWQEDLGTATLFFVVFVLMLYLASGQISYVIEGGLLLVLAGVFALRFFGVVRLRALVWANPWPYADNQSFQIVQSLLAFSAGSVMGTGIGQGSPTYIPVVHSDFVFAAIGEEWGLIGTLTLTICIALLVMRGLRITAKIQRRPFRAFLAAGISIMIAAQSLLIMMGALKLIPLTGVTLPFVSYGGSSLLTCFLMTGLLLVLSNEHQ